MRLYSIYEIHKDKLLRKPDGTPYADKNAVSRIVRKRLKSQRVLTNHGMSWQVPLSEIHRWNQR